MRNIIPTIGRKVWYHPFVANGDDPNPDRAMAYFGDQALDATVVYVWGDNTVNLRVIDHMGEAHVRTSVNLMPTDQPATPGTAEWMPYQKDKAQAETASA